MVVSAQWMRIWEKWTQNPPGCTEGIIAVPAGMACQFRNRYSLKNICLKYFSCTNLHSVRYIKLAAFMKCYTVSVDREKRKISSSVWFEIRKHFFFLGGEETWTFAAPYRGRRRSWLRVCWLHVGTGQLELLFLSCNGILHACFILMYILN
jgi:hypothetical protein